MKVNGFDIDVGVKCVFVEEAIREKPVVNILGPLLQGNDMPLSCNLLFEGIFFHPTGSRVRVVNAESALHNRTGRKAFSGTVHVRRDQDFVFAQFGP